MGYIKVFQTTMAAYWQWMSYLLCPLIINTQMEQASVCSITPAPDWQSLILHHNQSSHAELKLFPIKMYQVKLKQLINITRDEDRDQ